MFKHILAAASVAVMTALPATATTVEFDFTGGSGGGATSTSFTEDGLTVTVTAGSVINGFNYPGATTLSDDDGGSIYGYDINGQNFDDDAYVRLMSGGLGVANNVSCRRSGRCTTTDDDPVNVDGSNWDDFLQLSFSNVSGAASVNFVTATFAAFGGSDQFRIMYDTSGDGSLGNGDFLSYSQNGNPFSSFAPVSDNVFGFMATGSHSEWLLESLSVDVAEVPLPAGGLLLLAGLGGMVALRRRNAA